MRVTLEHIAEKAKVSTMTASAILTGRYVPRRADAVVRARRIHQVARELGYRPNGAARATSTGRFGNIALLISADLSRSNIPTRLLGSIHDALADRKLHMTLAKLSDQAVTDESFVPRILREWSADGLLINYHKNIPAGMEQLIESSRQPAIWINCECERDCVLPDDRDAGLRLTQHLIQQGHRRIAYVDFRTSFRYEPGEHYSQYARWEGYEAAMHHAGLEPRRIDFAQRAWRNKAALEFWTAPESTWLASSDRPTAVIAYSTEANTLLLAAHRLGLRVPDDLAIASFAESPISLQGLRLPTMLVPNEKVGQLAVDMLMHRIEQPEEHQPAVRVPFEFDPNPQPSGNTEPTVVPTDDPPRKTRHLD
jgi:LacI family transcriptional regulator